MLRYTETKYQNLNFGKTDCKHNKLTLLGTTNDNIVSGNGIVQGLKPDQRVGNEIYLTGIKYNLLLGQFSDRPNVTFKLFVVEWNDTAGTITNQTQFMYSNTGNIMLDPIQSHRFKVHKVYTYKSRIGMMEVGETPKEKTIPISFWVPLRRKIRFLDDNSNEMIGGMRQNFQVVIAVYDAYGTLTTDNIAYVQGGATIYYKDP